MSAIANLDSILDSIDTRKRKLREEDISSSSSSSSKSTITYKDPLASFYWTKHFDRASNNYYYHNSRTKVTQWEVPDDFVEEDQLHARASNQVQEATALFHTKRPGMYVLMDIYSLSYDSMFQIISSLIIKILVGSAFSFVSINILISFCTRTERWILGISGKGV